MMSDDKPPMSAVLVARAFEVMLPAHDAELMLNHNPHLNVYETVEGWTSDFDREDWVSPVEKQKAIATNELWVLQWYPNTPIGFNRIAAASLSAIAQYLADNGLAFGN
jgi:hypothetical protein